MLAVQGEALPFIAHYTEDGVDKTGLTVTVNVYRLAKADMTKSDLVTDGACSEIADGAYRYLLASGSNNADGVYLAIFYTATDTVDQQNIPAAWFVGYGNLPSIADILTDTGTTLPAEINAVDTDVWTYSSRTLTQSATSITSSVSGSSITDVRGDTWSIEITDLTLDSNKQQFAIKNSASDTDAEALLLVDSDTGLLYLNGSSDVTAGNATLSLAGTTLTLTVAASVTAQLDRGTFSYGIQGVAADGTASESYGGTFTITADVVRATS